MTVQQLLASYKSGPPPVTVYSNTSDGYIYVENASYATARSGGGVSKTLDSTGTQMTVGQDLNGAIYIVDECFLNFDLFAAGFSSGNVCSDAVLSFYITFQSVAQNFTVEVRSRDWGNTLELADFVAGDSLAGLTLLASRSTPLTTNVYFDLTENGTALKNAITAALAGDGVLRLIVVSDRVTNNNIPGASNEFVNIATANDTSGTKDPRLVVTAS